MVNLGVSLELQGEIRVPLVLQYGSQPSSRASRVNFGFLLSYSRGVGSPLELQHETQGSS